MKLISAVDLSGAERQAIENIAGLQADVRERAEQSQPWLRALERLQFVRVVRAGCLLGGHPVQLEDVIALSLGEEPLEAPPALGPLVRGLADAFRYAGLLAELGGPGLDLTSLRTLHFLLTREGREQAPGRWRSRELAEAEPPAPPPAAVASRMAELIAASGEIEQPPLLRGILAHLNLLLVQPFTSANSRLGRTLQGLIAAAPQADRPIFWAIDEYQAEHQQRFRQALLETAAQDDPLPWVRLCLNAGYRQSDELAWRLGEAEAIWDACRSLASNYGLARRTAGPLYQAANGVRLRNPIYRWAIVEERGGVEFHTASRDLRALVSSGLLESSGETRGRVYSAGPTLLHVLEQLRRLRPRPPVVDLFGQAELPFFASD